MLSGNVGRHGPMIHIKVMQTPERVEARKKAGLGFATPITILGLIDTGASRCAIDRTIIAGLDLRKRGSMSIHTPSTDGGYIQRNSYDVSIILGEGQPNPLVRNALVVEADLASQGFHALIGRDILSCCIFTFDGPAGMFRLEF